MSTHGSESEGTGRCPDCRVCSPTALDRILMLSMTALMTVLLLCRVEPFHSRCPVCGHPLRYHRKRAAV